MKNTFLPRVKGESKSDLTKRYQQLKEEIEQDNSNHTSFLLAQLKNDYDKLNVPRFINLIISISYLQWLVLISLLIILLIGLFPFLAQFVFNVEVKKDNGASFGDSYGVLNALFSGLAFAGVVIALLMQNKDLNLTREEFSKSVEAQNKSQEALHKQLEKMDISSRIDILSKYYEKLKSDTSPSKEQIFKTESVLESYAKEILNYSEYRDLLKPKLKYENGILRSPNDIIINFTNLGSNAKIIQFAFEPELEFVSKKDKEMIYSQMKLDVHFKRVDKFELRFVLEDSHQNEWYQKFMFKIENDKVVLVTEKVKQLD